LIISDVMMPSMDGYEFCKKIKTNWQTSHIPVILLTAKASTESRIEGLETGADAYLTKPFNSKELSVRIKNLLEQRKKLRERFSKEIKIDTSSIAVTSVDNEFLQKALDIAEKNLSNTEFNSEDFAKEMFMSRSQLHRKLVSLTEHGPGEFIRTFRLKKAAELILEKRLSVTQISFEVGFSSPSHFTKAFRQQFNCLPTEFIEKNNS
jgi:DNA-binding response OmpR family regulator